MSGNCEIYSSPWWLRGPHAQTIWSKLARKRRDLPLTRRRILTPDGDEVELYSLPHVANAPHVVLLHGLEGSLRSHYVNGILAAVFDQRLNGHIMMFRSCGAETNQTRRFYHSGETGDFRFVVDSLSAAHSDSRFFLVGVSLGGNVLLKYLGESADKVPRNVAAAAAVSVPYDLSRSATAIDSGFSRVYQRFFLTSLRRKISEKTKRFSGLPTPAEISKLQTIVAFDDIVTAPLHGFAGAQDYYRRSSALGFLAGVRVPTLLLSAYDDHFLPADVLTDVAAQAGLNDALHIEFHRHGGHVGFVRGRFPWRAEYFLDKRVLDFFADYMTSPPQQEDAR